MNRFFERMLSVFQEDFADVWDVESLTRILLRLSVAVIIGGIVGFQRERVGKSAGIRTHMLIAAGSAFFILVARMEGMSPNELSRVQQGIIAGIGFLGGGVILKITQDREIHGLTTAAGVWFVSALGIAVGHGRLTSALIATFFAWGILELLTWTESKWITKPEHAEDNKKGA